MLVVKGYDFWRSMSNAGVLAAMVSGCLYDEFESA